jgi:hypothetical protein
VSTRGDRGVLLESAGENKMKCGGHELYFEEKSVLIYPAAAVTASLSWGGARCYVGVMFLCP